MYEKKKEKNNYLTMHSESPYSLKNAVFFILIYIFSTEDVATSL